MHDIRECPWRVILMRIVPFFFLIPFQWTNPVDSLARPLNDPTYPTPLRLGLVKAAGEILADNPKKALTILTPLFKTYPDYTVLFTLAGMAYGKQGENQKAIVMEKRALTIDPKNLTARISLGIAEGNIGHFRQEIREETAVLRRDLKREAAWRALGWADGSIGQWKEARIAEEKAVALSPSDGEARMILGLALAHGGFLQEALLMEESAQKIDPDDEGIRRSLTFIKQQMNPPISSQTKIPDSILCWPQLLAFQQTPRLLRIPR